MEDAIFTKQGKLWTAIVSSVVCLFSLCAGWWLLAIPALAVAGLFWVLFYDAATHDAKLIAEDNRFQQSIQQPMSRPLLPQAPPQQTPGRRKLYVPDRINQHK